MTDQTLPSVTTPPSNMMTPEILLPHRRIIKARRSITPFKHGNDSEHRVAKPQPKQSSEKKRKKIMESRHYINYNNEDKFDKESELGNFVVMMLHSLLCR